MNLLIRDTDLLKVKDKIIQHVINSFFASGRLINALKCFVDGHGYENVSFTYWDDLDEYDKSNFYDKPFQGLELNFLSDEIIVEEKDFHYYMTLAAKHYLAWIIHTLLLREVQVVVAQSKRKDEGRRM